MAAGDKGNLFVLFISLVTLFPDSTRLCVPAVSLGQSVNCPQIFVGYKLSHQFGLRPGMARLDFRRSLMPFLPEKRRLDA